MNTHGFTLLESLIYIALFGVLMTGALVTVYELLQSSEFNRMHIAIQEEGTFIQRKINWALLGATTITTPNPATIVIIRPDLGFQSPLTIRFANGKVFFKREGSDEVLLTGAEFIVTDVVITIKPSSGTIPTQIHISYTINDIPFVYETYLHF